MNGSYSVYLWTPTPRLLRLGFGAHMQAEPAWDTRVLKDKQPKQTTTLSTKGPGFRACFLLTPSYQTLTHSVIGCAARDAF